MKRLLLVLAMLQISLVGVNAQQKKSNPLNKHIMKKLSLFLVALTMVLFSCKPEVEKPTVVTKSVGEVTKTSAKVIGQVTADGGAEVTERGVCWNTDGTPTILDFSVKDTEGGLGSYEISFTDLVPNTQYYVRAYAINEAGTSYGEEKTFVTVDPEEPEDPEQPEQPVGPVVITAEVTEITANTAVCGGEVVSGGDAIVIARGICWNTTGTPTVSDTYTIDGNGMGVYTSYMTDLQRGTTYYVRAYATDVKGVTSYGAEVSFTTKDVPAVAVDLGLSVKWATCNIGANSPEEYGDYFAWGETSTKETYTEDNCATYNVSMNDIAGNAQYDAATANWGGDWRLPTEEEMGELLNNCTWRWTTQNGVNGYNVKGPNGNSIFLPAAGYRNGSSLDVAGSCGYYWSSTPDEIYDYGAYGLYFYSDDHYMSLHGSRYGGRSVRPVLE